MTGHRRWLSRLAHRIDRDLVSKLFGLALTHGFFPVLRHVPSLPSVFRRNSAPVVGPWPAHSLLVPTELLGTPGIRRDPDAEQEAYDEAPLQDLLAVHVAAHDYNRSRLWKSLLVTGPRLTRATARAGVASRLQPDPRHSEDADLRQGLGDAAAELGLSAVGVAEYDPRYTFVQYQVPANHCRVVICVLEQNYEATQTAPSTRSERAAFSAYAEVLDRAGRLARYLKGCGYDAVVWGPAGPAVMIHYAVQAGLGQLGLNGQLLTPSAGSRCRIIVLTTDAPLESDQPKDFGIPAICDQCKACVERCPTGAIPAARKMYRGVEKAKINLKRCLPTVAQAEGCAVCMKVCPIQRYGLAAVIDHRRRTGDILGRHTDELEGYRWPDTGEWIGPGRKPHLSRDFFDLPDFDPSRRLPVVDVKYSHSPLNPTNNL